MSTNSPNMNLILPTIGVDSGLTWEQSVNSNSGILDGHNHGSGSGVQINPSGININSDLPFNVNNATLLRSSRYSVQASPLALSTDIGCTYVSGVDLYYNDVNGNKIQLTAGGIVNATSSGISSGTATASFSGLVLVVNAASNTPASIRAASIYIGNPGVSGSNYIQLEAPGALASNYNITLPAIPAQTNVMTLDTSGNMGSVTWDYVGQSMSSVGANAIGETMNSTGADAIQVSTTRSTGTSVGTLGVAISNSCGAAVVSTSGFITITNLSVNITTSGRPVFIGLIPDNSTNPSYLAPVSAQQNMRILRDGAVEIGRMAITVNTPVGSVYSVDVVSGGNHSYQMQSATTGSGELLIYYCQLVAYEL